MRQVLDEGTSFALAEDLDEAATAAAWLEGAPARCVLACRAGEVVGVAKMGPNRPGRGAHVATASFIVDATARGLGIGRRLGGHVVEWARTAGYRGIQFNAVVATNRPAMALWRSLGFAEVGRVPGAFSHPDLGYVDLCVLYLDLTAAG